MDPNAIIRTLRANEFLNVRFDASPEVIKRAYIQLMKIYHPDKNPKYNGRSTWICQMVADARDQALARVVTRGFPMLEHYTPVADDPGPDLCECGKPNNTEEPVCLSCGTMAYMPKYPTEENKAMVWKFVLVWAKKQGVKHDWDLACRIFNKHFGV